MKKKECDEKEEKVLILENKVEESRIDAENRLKVAASDMLQMETLNRKLRRELEEKQLGITLLEEKLSQKENDSIALKCCSEKRELEVNAWKIVSKLLMKKLLDKAQTRHKQKLTCGSNDYCVSA